MNNNQGFNKQRVKNFDKLETTSSVLSDYEDDAYEFINDGGIDDQSLYVLFNPTRKDSLKMDSDILSLTNTTNTFTVIHGELEAEEEEEEEEEEDPQVTHTQNESLSLKIDSWYDSNLVNSDIDDDNIASWNLDENLMNDAPSEDKLVFYGDDLLSQLNDEELAKFKKFHLMYDLKLFLLSKDPSFQSRINQLIHVLLHDNKGKVDNKRHSADRYNYIKMLKSSKPAFDCSLSSLAEDYRGEIRSRVDDLENRSTFSEGSSLVMCGGASWNDI